MTTAPALANEQIHSIPIGSLKESPTNTRRTWGDLDELAASFRDVGILQPLVARRLNGHYELVFGHRRFRAAQKAKLELVPVIVRVMSDAQALEAQVIENLQRKDQHPLEEAEGFEQLHKLGWSAEDMAAKIGKSRAYVFERIKLLDLCKTLRDAFYKDAFGASVALYLARLPSEKLQLEAWKAVQVPKWDVDRGITLSARRALGIINQHFMLRLADAPFDRGDAELVPAAGSCKDCPKRTGNQKELFADVSSPDVCTDPPCFESKRKAHVKAERDLLAEKGVKLVEGQKPHYEGDRIRPPEGFAKLTETHYEYDGAPKWQNKSYAAIVKASGLERERVVMLDEKGKTVELVSKALVSKALTKVGAARKLSPKQQAENEAAKVRRELVKKAGKKVIERILAKAKTAGTPSAEVWRLVALGVTWATDKEKARIAKASLEDLVVLVLEQLLGHDYEGELLEQAAVAYGVTFGDLLEAAKPAKKSKAKR